MKILKTGKGINIISDAGLWKSVGAAHCAVLDPESGSYDIRPLQLPNPESGSYDIRPLQLPNPDLVIIIGIKESFLAR